MKYLRATDVGACWPLWYTHLPYHLHIRADAARQRA